MNVNDDYLWEMSPMSDVKYTMCNHCNSRIKKYVAIATPMTFYDAETYCNSVYNTHLAGMHKYDDMDVLLTIAFWKLFDNGWWIGYGYFDGEYGWIDGTTLDYGASLDNRQWSTQYPMIVADLQDVDCIYVSNYAGSWVSGWVKGECTVEQPFIRAVPSELNIKYKDS